MSPSLFLAVQYNLDNFIAVGLRDDCVTRLFRLPVSVVYPKGKAWRSDTSSPKLQLYKQL